MASDWIKLEKTTVDKPEVHQMAAELSLDPDTVVGKLIRLWSWLDGVCSDGHATGVTQVTVDRITFCDGFAPALQKVGWLIATDVGYEVPKFERHMSKSAKKRALSNERKRRSREKSHTSSVTDVTVMRDQRREEKRNTPISPLGDYSVGFISFWKSYPRKIGKQAAWRSWQRQKLESIHDEIIQSVNKHIASAEWKKENGEFVPHPTTYLNQARWLDELQAEEQTIARPQGIQGS